MQTWYAKSRNALHTSQLARASWEWDPNSEAGHTQLELASPTLRESSCVLHADLGPPAASPPAPPSKGDLNAAGPTLEVPHLVPLPSPPRSDRSLSCGEPYSLPSQVSSRCERSPAFSCREVPHPPSQPPVGNDRSPAFSSREVPHPSHPAARNNRSPACSSRVVPHPGPFRPPVRNDRSPAFSFWEAPNPVPKPSPLPVDVEQERPGEQVPVSWSGPGMELRDPVISDSDVVAFLDGVLDGFRAIIGANTRARNPRHNDTGQCVATASVSSVCSRRSPSTPWDEKMSDQFCASRGRLRRVNWRAAEDLSGARGRSAALTREGSRERAVNTEPLPPWDQRVLSSQCGEPVPPWPEPNTSKRQISGAVPWPEAPASCTYKDSPPLPWSAQDTSSDKATDPKLPGRLDEFAVTMRRQALRAFLEETCGSVSSAFERLIESVPRTRSSQRSGLASERWRHALTPAEFRTSMTALGYGARSVSWNALFQCVDVDGDGRVSLQDLLNALERDPPSRISAPPVPW